MSISRTWGPFLAASAAAVAAVGGGCQQQNFEPVQAGAFEVGGNVITVTAKQLPPNIMLVVDRSGSMVESVTGQGPTCTTDGTIDGGFDPTSTNPCKWNDLRSAFADPVTGLLVQSANDARFGLLAFPANTGMCDVGAAQAPIGSDVVVIRDQLYRRLAPGGGTPSAAALRLAASDPGLVSSEPNRQRIAMLLTDGLPNCNPGNAPRCALCRTNPSTCLAPTGCKPTFMPGDSCGTAPFDGAACLDGSGLLAAITELRNAGVSTVVIGFGSDARSSDAQQVLSQAALAGGHPRQGAPVPYYQADSVQELRAYLEEIIKAFPCKYALNPKPGAPDQLQVKLVDQLASSERQLKRGVDWNYTSERLDEMELTGWACTAVQNAGKDQLKIVMTFVSPL